MSDQKSNDMDILFFENDQQKDDNDQYCNSTDSDLNQENTIFEIDIALQRRRIVRCKLENTEVGEGVKIGDERCGIYSSEEENIEKTIMKHDSWEGMHYHSLPEWLQDNEFLHTGHRPPLQTFSACFKSIFRLHTETGNIWTHMIGCIFFFLIALDFIISSTDKVQLLDKLALMPFFIGAIIALGLSFGCHAFYCHSEPVGKFLTKLDYVGISLLTVGSIISWLYYSFYCLHEQRITYMVMIVLLGIMCVTVSLWDKFSQPHLRPLRASMFAALGLSALLPLCHFISTHGYSHAVHVASFHWEILMACLYMAGTILYALRIPERFFPGKCDIWFQSHQIFHLCVLGAAFAHYRGVSEMFLKRMSQTSCEETTNVL